jgi:hypothetical protein
MLGEARHLAVFAGRVLAAFGMTLFDVFRSGQ